MVPECDKNKEIENLRKEIEELKKWLGYESCFDESIEEFKEMIDRVYNQIDKLVSCTEDRKEDSASIAFYPIHFKDNIKDFKRHLDVVLINARKKYPSREIYIHNYRESEDTISFDILCKSKEEKANDEYKIGDKIEIPMGDGKSVTAYVAGIDCEPDVKDHHYTLVANFGDCKMGKSALRGYLGAKDMQDFLTSKTEILKRFFGDRLVRREIMVSSGIFDAPDSIYDERNFVVSEYYPLKTYLYLMSEVELFGHRDYSYEYEMHNSAYELFKKKDYRELFGRVDIWLRGVYSVTNFCIAEYDSLPSFSGASSGLAAVALFTIK